MCEGSSPERPHATNHQHRRQRLALGFVQARYRVDLWWVLCLDYSVMRKSSTRGVHVACMRWALAQVYDFMPPRTAYGAENVAFRPVMEPQKQRLPQTLLHSTF